MSISDADLHALLDRDVDLGWRAFIDAHTPVLLACIERAGLRDRDEAMDLYARVCERLSARGCARLRRHDPGQGSIAAWLAAVVRHAAVDWVRSRAGRRRLFGVIADLDPFHQQVFQQYYWHDRMPSAIAGALAASLGRPVSLMEILGAVDVINERLTERHYRELLSLTARSRTARSLDADPDDGGLDPPDPAPTADERLAAAEQEAALQAALAAMPVEDVAVIRLHYLEGLSLADVRRALHLPDLSRARLSAIVLSLKVHLGARAGLQPGAETGT